MSYAQGVRDFENPLETALKAPLERSLYDLAAAYGIWGPCSIVSGPDWLRHVRNARETVSPFPEHTVSIVERDRDVAGRQALRWLELLDEPRRLLWQAKRERRPGEIFPPGKNRALAPLGEFLPVQHNVSFRNCPIEQHEEYGNLVDADLMATCVGCGDALCKTLSRHSENRFNIKGLIFTTALRTVGKEETFRWLRSELLPILGCKLRGTALRSQDNLTNDPDTRKSTHGSPSINAKQLPLKKSDFLKSGRVRGLHLNTYNDDGGPMFTGLVVYK